jgi:RNA polymerase sigma-70 factor (family 1)
LQQHSLHINQVGLNEEKFLGFFKQNYSSLCFFANRYVNDPSLAEDIVGDVALKLWEKKDKLESIHSFKSYFYISVRNACIDWIKKEQNQSKKEAAYLASTRWDQQTALENIIRTETFGELEAAIDSLPSQCRKVFIKLFVEGKSLSVTAEEMRLSIFTVKAQRQRGIQLLRNQLGSTRLAVWLAALTMLRN